MPCPFMFGWLIAALGGLLIFGTWASHYALPVMLPAACCAAAFFAIHRRGMETAIAVLLISGIAGQVLVAKKKSRRGDSEQAEAITRAIGTGDGKDGRWGRRVSGRVDLGGGRFIKKKKNKR